MSFPQTLSTDTLKTWRANLNNLAANTVNKNGGDNLIISNLTVQGSLSTGATTTTVGYTVATLPAGTIGMRAYVTDATAPTFLGALTGGGTVKCPVFYNGTAWVAG